ncbi:MAG: N-acetyltransferase [Candidatus Altiarchaeota archaeon]
MDVRKASVRDVDAIRALIDVYSRQGKMLSRSLSYLYDNIRDYFVVEEGGRVIGCVGLHITWSDLAEIKSLAVDPVHQQKGVGRALLEATFREAKEFGISRLFTLTLEPDFFTRHGFRVIPRESLPMKIWGECIQCPKYPECDEVALEYPLK